MFVQDLPSMICSLTSLKCLPVSIVLHFTPQMPGILISGIPNNAGPPLGTTKNLQSLNFMSDVVSWFCDTSAYTSEVVFFPTIIFGILSTVLEDGNFQSICIFCCFSLAAVLYCFCYCIVFVGVFCVSCVKFLHFIYVFKYCLTCSLVTSFVSFKTVNFLAIFCWQSLVVDTIYELFLLYSIYLIELTFCCIYSQAPHPFFCIFISISY